MECESVMDWIMLWEMLSELDVGVYAVDVLWYVVDVLWK